MAERQHIRYDPLYRVIDMTREIRFIEGNLSPFFDRLKGISNLGIIPEILEMAKYPKYEHHLGTVFQVNCFLDNVKIKDEYCMPLKLSSLFMHIGHLPFTYSTERALLLACNKETMKGNKARIYVERKVRKVLQAAGLSKDEQQEHQEKIFSLEDYKSLYRYFSCEVFLENWKKVKREFELEDGQRRIVIRNLVDSKNDGYKYLELADKADYVQRDALYFGTVRLDISPKHLYGPGLLGSEPGFFSVDEVKLIENNLDYLRERFYESKKARWVSRLFEKIVANLILSSNFEMSWLEELDDSQFKRLITENIKPDTKKAKLPDQWTKRARDLLKNKTKYSQIFRLSDVSFEKQESIVDIEDKLLDINKSFRRMITYPFEKGLLVDISHSGKPVFPPHPNYRQFEVSLFQDDSNKRFLELLKIVQRLSKYCSVTHIEKIREGIGKQLSWTGAIRIDNKNVTSAISEALLAIEKKDKLKRRGALLKEYVRSIVSLRTFSSLWYNYENVFGYLLPITRYTKASSEYIKEEDISEKFARLLLSLPLPLLQYKKTACYLDRIYDALLEMIPKTDSNEKKGYLFEALFLINRMRKKKGKFQFLISNLVVVDPSKEKDKRDLHEFDLLELAISEENKPECWIYACSIGDKYKQDNESQMKKLAESIHDIYLDLKITSKYVIPEDKTREVWKPKEEETGVGVWGYTKL